MEQNPPAENATVLASRELVKKQSLELMQQLQEKNNPAQPFITVFGEGEDQMVILNKSIDIRMFANPPSAPPMITTIEESAKPLFVRLMITSTGVVALESSSLNNKTDYLNSKYGVRAARKEGYTMNATIEHGYGNDRKGSILSISPLDDSSNDEQLTTEEKEQRGLMIKNRQSVVKVLNPDFQDSEKIQQAIRESYQEAKDLDQPKIKLLIGLNDFARTLGENSSTPSQPPAGPGPAA